MGRMIYGLFHIFLIFSNDWVAIWTPCQQIPPTILPGSHFAPILIVGVIVPDFILERYKSHPIYISN